MIALAVGLLIVGLWLRPGWRAYGCMVGAFVVISPLLGLCAAACGVAIHYGRSITRQRGDATKRTEETLLALDLFSLGSTAGLPFHASASAAADEIASDLSADLKRAVTRVNAGLPHALPDGPLAAAFDAAEWSAASGASLADRLVDLARDVRSEQAALERERIERLPVKLLFPLAFLILPGFMLVAVVPSIVSGINQLKF